MSTHVYEEIHTTYCHRDDLNSLAEVEGLPVADLVYASSPQNAVTPFINAYVDFLSMGGGHMLFIRCTQDIYVWYCASERDAWEIIDKINKIDTCDE